MTIRQLTLADGSAQLVINYDCGGMIVTAGQVLDVPPGSPLEAAIGVGNLTSLSNTVLADDQQGDGGQATDNGQGADMALSRFVVTPQVTLTPDILAACEPGSGGAAGFGNSATVVPVAGSEGNSGCPGCR